MKPERLRQQRHSLWAVCVYGPSRGAIVWALKARVGSQECCWCCQTDSHKNRGKYLLLKRCSVQQQGLFFFALAPVHHFSFTMLSSGWIEPQHYDISYDKRHLLWAVRMSLIVWWSFGLYIGLHQYVCKQKTKFKFARGKSTPESMMKQRPDLLAAARSSGRGLFFFSFLISVIFVIFLRYFFSGPTDALTAQTMNPRGGRYTQLW